MKGLGANKYANAEPLCTTSSWASVRLVEELVKQRGSGAATSVAVVLFALTQLLEAPFLPFSRFVKELLPLALKPLFLA